MVGNVAQPWGMDGTRWNTPGDRIRGATAKLFANSCVEVAGKVAALCMMWKACGMVAVMRERNGSGVERDRR